jgi:2,4-dienoyl-CoA reductase-like NADH-dependent reductase (Old Yellow Enzyme family)
MYRDGSFFLHIIEVWFSFFLFLLCINSRSKLFVWDKLTETKARILLGLKFRPATSPSGLMFVPFGRCALPAPKSILMPHLFEPLTLRSITLKNRIVVSPMCQYSAEDGFANDWHLVHLGSHAVGGAGLIIAEATAIAPEGRITPQDLGIWKDEHIAPLRRITEFIEAHGSVPGVQLAHAGRKSSTRPPWERSAVIPSAEGGWTTVAPSPVPFREGDPAPQELTEAGIQQVISNFRQASRRALVAGFKVIELHAAHGYLLHQFLSPLSNMRSDQWGGSFDNRIRLLLGIIDAVKEEWPGHLPLLVRISATDWTEGGWTEDESVALARILVKKGIDLIDCSTGGNVPRATIPVGPPIPSPIRRTHQEGNRYAHRRRWDDHHRARNAKQLSVTEQRIWCFWHGSCCAILTFRCMQVRSWALSCNGRCNMSGRNSFLACKKLRSASRLFTREMLIF